MFKKKIKWIALSGISAIATFPVISCSASDSLSSETYKLAGRELSKTELLDYVQKRTDQQVGKQSSSLGQWRMDGVDKVFDSPSDIDAYVQEHNIKNKVASITLDNDALEDLSKDYFASVPANSVIPLETNKDGEIKDANKSMALAFKGNNDQIYFIKADSPQSQIDLIEQTAKNSWIQFHSTYLFNGIYFKNIEDLDYYLRNTIYNKAKSTGFDKMINKEVNLPISKNAEGKLNYESFILPKSQDGKIDETKLKATLTERIKINSEKVLSVDSKVISQDDISNRNLVSQTLKSHVKYWNIGSQDLTSYYIVDTTKDSRGTLYGSYFLNSPNDIGGVSSNGKRSGIMNTVDGEGGASWARDTSTPTKADLQGNNNADAELMGSTISESISNMVKHISSNNDDKNKEFGMYDVLELDGKENGFTNFLNRISSSSSYNYKSLGDGLKAISNELKSGKKYNSFYSLPVLRGWLISRLLANGVSQVNLEKANEYFVDVANEIENQINIDLGSFLVDDNKLDLNDIYGFDNHNDTLYVDPRTNLVNIPENVKNELRVSQGVKSYVSNYLTYVPLHGMIDDLQNVQKIYGTGYGTGYGNGYTYQNSAYPVEKIDLINFDSTTKRKKLDFNKLLFTGSNTSGDFINKLGSRFDQFIDLYMKQDLVNNQNNIIKNFNSILDDNKKNASSKMLELKKEYDNFSTQIKSNDYSPDSSNKDPISKGFKEYMNGDKLLTTIKSALDTTTSVLSDVKTITEDIVKTMKEIAKVTKFLGKLETALSVCAFLDVSFVAIDVIMGIIDFFTPVTSKVYYSYKSANQQSYYWDGGEHVSQFMGLRSEDKHKIDELKLLEPIQITVPHFSKASTGSGTASNFYFDGKFYNGASEVFDQVAEDIFEKLNQGTSDIDEFIKVAFDDKVTLTNKYLDNTWTQSTGAHTTIDTLSTLVDDIANSIKEELQPGHVPLYLKNIYSTPNGLITSNKNIAVNEYVADIVGKIKPTYVFQRPQVSTNGLTQLPFRLPYPYYSLSSNEIIDKKDKEIDRLVALQYEYNSNIDPEAKNTTGDDINKNTNIETSTKNIIKHSLEKLSKSFSIPQRKVSYREVLTTNNFSELNGNVLIKNVYVAKSPLGQTKYFLNLSAAILWIRIEYNTRLLATKNNNNEFVYHSEVDEKDHIFSSITSEIKWIMKNEVNLPKEVQ